MSEDRSLNERRCGLATARRSAFVPACALRAIADYYRHNNLADYDSFAYLTGDGLIYRSRSVLIRARARVLDPPPCPLPAPTTMICAAVAESREDVASSWWLSYDIRGAWLAWLLRSELLHKHYDLAISQAHEREASALMRRLNQADARLARASCVAHARRLSFLRALEAIETNRHICRMTATRRAIYVYTRRNYRTRIAATRCADGIHQLDAAADAEEIVIALSYMCDDEVMIVLSSDLLLLSSYHFDVFIPIIS